MSAEHGIDSTGKYVGDNDNQLQRVGVYFNEGQEGRQVDVDSNDGLSRSRLRKCLFSSCDF
jgi:hypothetical protein